MVSKFKTVLTWISMEDLIMLFPKTLHQKMKMKPWMKHFHNLYPKICVRLQKNGHISSCEK